MTTTHDVSIGDTEVVKRFRSSGRGEAEREWTALTLLDRHRPGLAPRPIRRFVEDGRPVVVMTRLDGEGGRVSGNDQVAALVDTWAALHSAPTANVSVRLWTAGDVLAFVEGTRRPAGLEAEVGAALDAGLRWARSADAGRLATELSDPVFGHGDGNLANVLWDGRTCRLVDFEDSGLSDRAYEYADLIEHISSRPAGALDGESLLAHLAPGPALARRTHQARRLMALYWLIMLLPGNPADARNPPGTLSRQAVRLSELLS